MFRAISRTFTAHQQREGGGFLVRRPVGGPKLFDVDPFLMLDHMGPVNYGPGEAIGAPDHPHRGFETVTYILSGGLHHQDSQGNQGNLTDGWVQWMTAGSGVIHSEMPTDELIERGGLMEGFQLWVNLPAKDKMIKPRYQDTPPEKIPKVKTPDGKVEVAVIAGQALGTPATIETRSPMMYLDIHLGAGGSDGTLEAEIPSNYKGFIYVYRGGIQAGGSTSNFNGMEFVEADMGQVLVFSEPSDEVLDNPEKAVVQKVILKPSKSPADSDCRALLLGGIPLREPIARHGPFVMSTRDEIIQAVRDYQSGQFGQIDGEAERMQKTAQARKAQVESDRWK
ncbi:hypothetical protein HK102_002314 [Quaeritorhiza haematococci]|nr:hypothetical protein HK102_002314 [Quaeritorhiza haematococci]